MARATFRKLGGHDIIFWVLLLIGILNAIAVLLIYLGEKRIDVWLLLVAALALLGGITYHEK